MFPLENNLHVAKEKKAPKWIQIYVSWERHWFSSATSNDTLVKFQSIFYNLIFESFKLFFFF